jgi:3-keto-5-aminohexanoate cleavage enzyme
MEKLIITAAITGGASPESNPYLPKTPKEQIQAAVDAYHAGASVIHIHARNPVTFKGDHKAEYFAEAIAGIRGRCDALINVTTGGSGKRVDGEWLYREVPEESVKGRVSVIPELCKHPETRPDIASFNAGSPVIDIYHHKNKEFLLKFVMVHSFPDMVYMAKVMKEHGVKPELECYDVGMINNALFLEEIGALEKPLSFQFVLGVLGQIPASFDNLLHMKRCLPDGALWSVCAVGLNEIPMVTAGMLLGGNIRVGFEDNIYLSKGVPAKSNAELVEKAARIARELDREIASPAEARSQLKLPGGA